MWVLCVDSVKKNHLWLNLSCSVKKKGGIHRSMLRSVYYKGTLSFKDINLGRGNGYGQSDAIFGNSHFEHFSKILGPETKLQIPTNLSKSPSRDPETLSSNHKAQHFDMKSDRFHKKNRVLAKKMSSLGNVFRTLEIDLKFFQNLIIFPIKIIFINYNSSLYLKALCTFPSPHPGFHHFGPKMAKMEIFEARYLENEVPDQKSASQTFFQPIKI